MSAPKSQPVKQLLVSIPPTILVNIREKTVANWQRPCYQEPNQLLAKVDWNRAQGVEERSMG
jgi:hypothetical protein